MIRTPLCEVPGIKYPILSGIAGKIIREKFGDAETILGGANKWVR